MFIHGQSKKAATEIMDSPTFGNEATGKRRYKAIDEHLYSDLKDEAVILNLANGRYYGLNAVGVSIWKALLEPATLGEIEIGIMREFAVDQETCGREVTAFLDKMAEEELIEIIDD
jgi:Coenzyme PQQ synthesis protein D (PqqD)